MERLSDQVLICANEAEIALPAGPMGDSLDGGWEVVWMFLADVPFPEVCFTGIRRKGD